MSKQAQGLPCSGGNNLPQEMLAQVQSRIVTLRGLKVLLDADVADLYGVETKRVNEAVRNNPDKFPQDYMFVLTVDELQDLRTSAPEPICGRKKRPQNFLPKAVPCPRLSPKRDSICWQPYLKANEHMR